ncbi:MAG: DNA-binding protein [Planctomycetes bacterium RBG_16_64_10]|nr:MAG: DNA-binding protein [Planctomycetes bacterium RBG_16_64_10]
MPNRSHDWLKQAVRDLEHGREAAQSARHEWACFAAQQAAEKAVKALHLHLGQEVWGHVVRRVIEELPATISVPADFLDKARVLDGFYIPTRYPNGHPEGSPGDHYGSLQSGEALRYAGEIVEFVRSQMA